MALEITGKLIKLLPEQSGTGKNGQWLKQEFVIETTEQYPKKICFSAWNDKIPFVKNCSTGDLLKVSFNIESREYNERWYTELRSWKIDLVNGDNNTKQEEPPFPKDITTFSADTDSDDLPF